jgi:glycosyltransferase involved in cell wall biosynthesis
MRIVLLSTNMAVGGAETQVVRLAIELQSRRYDVHVVSLVQPSAFGKELADAGVSLHAPGLFRIPSVLRTLRPQVLHCHMFHANVAGRLLRLIMPFPAVISTIHSMAESARGSDRIRSRDLAYRITDPLADCTVAVSAAVAERHSQARAVRKAAVIPNGIDTSRYRPDPAARERTRSQLGVTGEFVWIAVGRLMWKKNYPALLRAFGEIDSGVLWIAGTGPDEASLQALAGPNVRFLSARDDVPDLLNAADAFVMSSSVEGLPLVLLEAAACGLPCVATDVGGVRETGIGIVTTHEGLADAINQVLHMSPAARRHMGNTARRIVMERYSIEVVVSQWEALYRKLLPST